MRQAHWHYAHNIALLGAVFAMSVLVAISAVASPDSMPGLYEWLFILPPILLMLLTLAVPPAYLRDVDSERVVIRVWCRDIGLERENIRYIAPLTWSFGFRVDTILIRILHRRGVRMMALSGDPELLAGIVSAARRDA